MRLRQWFWGAAWSIMKRRRRLSWKGSRLMSRMSSTLDIHCRSGWPETGQRASPRASPAAPLWRELFEDLRSGVAKPRIAARFHAGVAAAFTRAAVEARAATGIDQVALSGGCMHNRRLARLLRAGLEAQGFEVFQHEQVSPGDGGLSYGQAVVAAAILRNDSADHRVRTT